MLKTNAILLAVLLTGATFPAWADDCAPVTAAMIAGAKTPFSSTVNMTIGGKPQTTQSVMTGSTLYVQVNGKWVDMKMSSADLVSRIQDKIKTAKSTCEHVGGDSVGGEPATVYNVHTVSEGHVSDNKVWVSSKGLPLKSESRLESGDVVVSTYNYSHVSAPEGATTLGTQK